MTFVDWDDLPRWGLINKSLDLGIPQPQETYSSSDHLYSDLDIPRGATGKLPRSAQTRAGLAAEEIEDIEGPTRTSTGNRGRGGPRGGRDGGSRDAGSRDAGSRDTRTRGRGSRALGEGSTPPVGATASDGETSRPRRARTRRRTTGGRQSGQPVAD